MWYENPAQKTGARKYSRFMAPVSGACVLGITTPGQKATGQKATATHLRVYCPVRQTNPLCELS